MEKTCLFLIDMLYGVITVIDQGDGSLNSVWSRNDFNGFIYYGVTDFRGYGITNTGDILRYGESHSELPAMVEGTSDVTLLGSELNHTCLEEGTLKQLNLPDITLRIIKLFEDPECVITHHGGVVYDNVIHVFHAESNMSVEDLPPAKDILNKQTLITLTLTEYVYLITSIIDEVFITPYKRNNPLGDDAMTSITSKKGTYFIETELGVQPTARREFVAKMSRNLPTNDPLINEYASHLTSLFKEQMKREQFNVNTK